MGQACDTRQRPTEQTNRFRRYSWPIRRPIRHVRPAAWHPRGGERTGPQRNCGKSPNWSTCPNWSCPGRTCTRIPAHPSSAHCDAMACGRLRGGSVSGAAGGGERSLRSGSGGGQAWRVQNQAGKLRADAATGGGRGNSRLHLHPRRHSRRSGHALRAPGHHHWSALSSCASGESTRSGAWRHAESKATAVEIGASSMCCEASVLALGECPAPARPR